VILYSLKSLREKTIAWLKLARLQFYPMGWVAYTIGAASAARNEHQFDLSIYLIGYLCIFLMELCTVFTNEYFDFKTDSINKNGSVFTGGSRMIVSGKIGFTEIRIAIVAVAFLTLFFGYILLRIFPGNSGFLIALILVGLILGAEYTAPPIRFSYRGLGEFVVAFMFSPYLIVSGYFFQTGYLPEYETWLLSVPLFLAIFPAIILAGIPDHKSDLVVSKKTLAVILGPRKAAILALLFASLAAAFGILLWRLKIVSGTIGLIFIFTIPHTVLLGVSIFRYLQTEILDKRIVQSLTLALTYIVWFGTIPLLYLIWG
jgi:1,4-dihydroxy-2-naphthoate octaprenyltransferase